MANTESVTPEVTTSSTTVASNSTGVAPGAAGEESALAAFLPLIGLFVIFYFLMIRPQQQKYKKHIAMVTGIRRGDKVVTGGGVFGKVTKVEAEEGVIYVEIAEEVVVKVLASSISNVEPAEKPVNDNAKDKKK